MKKMTSIHTYKMCDYGQTWQIFLCVIQSEVKINYLEIYLVYKFLPCPAHCYVERYSFEQTTVIEIKTSATLIEWQSWA